MSQFESFESHFNTTLEKIVLHALTHEIEDWQSKKNHILNALNAQSIKNIFSMENVIDRRNNPTKNGIVGNVGMAFKHENGRASLIGITDNTWTAYTQNENGEWLPETHGIGSPALGAFRFHAIHGTQEITDEMKQSFNNRFAQELDTRSYQYAEQLERAEMEAKMETGEILLIAFVNDTWVVYSRQENGEWQPEIEGMGGTSLGHFRSKGMIFTSDEMKQSFQSTLGLQVDNFLLAHKKQFESIKQDFEKIKITITSQNPIPQKTYQPQQKTLLETYEEIKQELEKHQRNDLARPMVDVLAAVCANPKLGIKFQRLPNSISINDFELSNDTVAAFGNNPLRLLHTVEYHQNQRFLLDEKAHAIEKAIEQENKRHAILVRNENVNKIQSETANFRLPENQTALPPLFEQYREQDIQFPSDCPVSVFGRHQVNVNVWQLVKQMKRYIQDPNIDDALSWNSDKRAIEYHIDGEVGFLPTHEFASTTFKGVECGAIPFCRYVLADFISPERADVVFDEIMTRAAEETLLHNFNKDDLLSILNNPDNLNLGLNPPKQSAAGNRYIGDNHVIVIKEHEQSQSWRVHKGGIEPENVSYTSTLDLFRTLTGIHDYGEAKRKLGECLLNAEYNAFIPRHTAVLSEAQQMQKLKDKLPMHAPQDKAYLYQEYFTRERGLPEYLYHELTTNKRMYNGIHHDKEAGNNIPVLVFLPDDFETNRNANIRSIHVELTGDKLPSERKVNKSLSMYVKASDIHKFTLPLSETAKRFYQPPEKRTVAFTEAPLDTASYAALFPNEEVCTQNGVHGTEALTNALKAYVSLMAASPIQAVKELPKLVYACDNSIKPKDNPELYAPLRKQIDNEARDLFFRQPEKIHDWESALPVLQARFPNVSESKSWWKTAQKVFQAENDLATGFSRAMFALAVNNVYDEASNKVLNESLLPQIGGYCETLLANETGTHSFDDFDDVVRALHTLYDGKGIAFPFDEKQINAAQQVFDNHFRQSDSVLGKISPAAAALTDLWLKQTDLFEIRTPYMPEYGAFKDWNALLTAAKQQEREQDAQLPASQRRSDLMLHLGIQEKAAEHFGLSVNKTPEWEKIFRQPEKHPTQKHAVAMPDMK